ncbi:Tenascin-X [Aphelenchoides bicaudatus]|nr:Tenascin-X [Aphelenchoides bicaudatus]
MIKVTLVVFLYLSATFAELDFNKTPTGEPGKLCYNGKRDGSGQCVCFPDYSGKLCERQKHCGSFERAQNYSCIFCKDGWSGPDCDFINCKNGLANKEQTECVCDKPYSGLFCDQLKTTDVYLHYNSSIYSFGPVGVFSILPLIFILFFCNWLAKKQQLKKAEEAFEEQFQKEISSDLVKVLLKK